MRNLHKTDFDKTKITQKLIKSASKPNQDQNCCQIYFMPFKTHKSANPEIS